MSLADDLRAEAEALLKVAAARDVHTASVDRETAAVKARGEAGVVAEKSATTPGFTPYTGSGTPAGDYQFHGYTGSGTPAGDPNDGPGVSGGHTQSSFGGGSTFLRAYNSTLMESEAWVEAHCKLITIKVPNPRPYATLGESGLVDLAVWDCRGPMKNADALFVAKGAWEAIAGESAKLGSGGGAGGTSGGASSSSSGGSAGGSSGVRSGSNPAAYGGNPVIATPPTTQDPHKVYIQPPTAPTPGDAAIIKALQPLGVLLGRIAKAAENPASDNLGLRRQGKL